MTKPVNPFKNFMKAGKFVVLHIDMIDATILGAHVHALRALVTDQINEGFPASPINEVLHEMADDGARLLTNAEAATRVLKRLHDLNTELCKAVQMSSVLAETLKQVSGDIDNLIAEKDSGIDDSAPVTKDIEERYVQAIAKAAKLMN